MKFKQSDGQNQRIERITASHLVIGINMAKETHVAIATNYRGIVLSNRHLSFSNTIEVLKSYDGGWKDCSKSTGYAASSLAWNPPDTIGGTWWDR